MNKRSANLKYHPILQAEYKEVCGQIYKLIDILTLFIGANNKVIKDYQEKRSRNKRPTRLMIRST